MTRLQADFALLIVAIIWGTAFVAQKTSIPHLGIFSFISLRFAISALAVLPFACREWRTQGSVKTTPATRKDLFFVCIAFAAAVTFQQLGIKQTTVGNSAFLTGLYALFTPLICFFLYREKISGWIVPAALLSVAGVWLLSGVSIASLSAFNPGDALTLLCAVFFAWQMALVGRILQKSGHALALSCLQYAAAALLALPFAILFESITWQDVADGAAPLLYASLISGGIAYTLQMVAQRYAPASDSAVILSSEGLFGALAGAFLLNETMNGQATMGAALIITALLMVQLAPIIIKKKENQ